VASLISPGLAVAADKTKKPGQFFMDGKAKPENIRSPNNDLKITWTGMVKERIEAHRTV